MALALALAASVVFGSGTMAPLLRARSISWRWRSAADSFLPLLFFLLLARLLLFLLLVPAAVGGAAVLEMLLVLRDGILSMWMWTWCGWVDRVSLS